MPNGHQLVPRDGSFGGFGYQALITDWMNWLIMDDPDDNNDGVVVYLRGIDFRRVSGSYSNFIRTGTERFVIGLDQAVFWPIIMYFVDAKHHERAENAHKRLLHVTNLLNNGRQPGINDALISFNNGNPQPINAGGYADFRFISDTETDLDVHGQDYDSPKNLCPNLDVPLKHSGNSKCRVAGYFLLVSFNQEGLYRIMSNGTGELGYRTSTLVEIEVTQRIATRRMRLLVQKTWKETHP